MAEPVPRPWRVGRAGAGDCERLAALPDVAGGAARSKPAWRDWLTDPATMTYLAETSQGRVIAVLDARQAADEAEIIDLWVAPPARRQGIAAALLDRLATDLEARGAIRLFLEVAVDNAAASALYRKHGFTVAASRKGYYARPGAEPADALVMVRVIGGCARP